MAKLNGPIERVDAHGNRHRGTVVRKMPRGRLLVEWEDGRRTSVCKGDLRIFWESNQLLTGKIERFELRVSVSI